MHGNVFIINQILHFIIQKMLYECAETPGSKIYILVMSCYLQ